MALQDRHRELSVREREVLPLMLKGHSNKAIGEIMNVQAGTIKKHRAAIYEKLLVQDLNGLISLFDGLEASAFPP